MTIAELIKGVNIVLGAFAVDQCPSFDANDNGLVTIEELVSAVNNALSGCPVTGRQAQRVTTAPTGRWHRRRPRRRANRAGCRPTRAESRPTATAPARGACRRAAAHVRPPPAPGAGLTSGLRRRDPWRALSPLR